MMTSSAELHNLHEGTLRSYQHMLHNVPDGIIFLFSSRFSDSVKSTADDLAVQYHHPVGKVLEELRRLIAIKTFVADEDGTKIMPTTLMDKVWLAIIIDTKVYANLQTALGTKLSRRFGVTEPAADQEARKLRISTMKCLYMNFFGSEPLGPAYPQLLMPRPQSVIRQPVIPNSITLNIRFVTGKTFPVTFPRGTTIVGVKNEIQAIEGIEVAQQRLVSAGKEPNGELLDEKTLEQYEFVDQSTIYLLYR